ncbi:spoVK [Symbiodinium sp. CCMP2592]|nr:spoVK [Symbiodinium sp. CCMP2592]
MRAGRSGWSGSDSSVRTGKSSHRVVLAGYAIKMDVLMDCDPRLRCRFSSVLQLEDYSAEELAEICEHTAEARFQVSFVPGLRDALAAYIRKQHGNEMSRRNGGLAVTLAERAFHRFSTRLGDASSLACRQLLPEDFVIAMEDEQKRVTTPRKMARNKKRQTSRKMSKPGQTSLALLPARLDVLAKLRVLCRLGESRHPEAAPKLPLCDDNASGAEDSTMECCAV